MIARLRHRANPRREGGGRTAEIIRLLDKRIAYVPDDIRPEFCDGEYFQLFEVMFAKLMSLSQADFSWLVTPYDGDGGLDFLGEKNLFESARLPVQALFRVGGQCKMRSGGKDKPYDLLSGDIGKMVDTPHRISYAIIAYLSEIERQKLTEAAEQLERIHRMAVCPFDIRDIAALVAQHRPEIEGLLGEWVARGELTEAEREHILAHFLSFETKPSGSFCLVAGRSHACAGVPFVVTCAFTTAAVVAERLRFRWRPAPEADGCSYVVQPGAALADEGAPLPSSDTFTYPIELTLVCYAPGRQRIGRVEIVDSAEEVVASLDLGEVELADTFHPPFFWPPYETPRRKFQFEWDGARGGAVREIAIVGHGGTGKTRFCQELAFLAQANGGWAVSIDHPTNLQEPYALLGDLAYHLLPAEARQESPKESVHRLLTRLAPDLARTAGSSLGALYVDGGQKGRLDHEAVIQILQVLLVNGLRRGPLLLHVSNLHWAMADTLTILGEAIRRLRRVSGDGALRHGLCVVYEGRINESFEARKDQQGIDWSCAVFEDFLDRSAPVRLTLKGWSDDVCRSFLTNFFDRTQAGLLQVKLELVPHRDRLVEQVLRYASGNPQHMVEQIRLLRTKGIVASNPRTGLLYAVDAELKDYHAPEKVMELIGQRFAYYRETAPSLFRLLRLLALVSDRSDAGLFEALRARVAPEVTDAALEATDFVLLPDQRMGGAVRFRHENYFHAARGIALGVADRETGVAVHLAWIDSLKRRDPQTQLLRATVLCESPTPDFAAIQKILRPALGAAERGNQPQVALRIAEMLIAAPTAGESTSRRLFRLETSLHLVSLMTSVGDRRQAAELATRISEEIERQPLPATGRPWTGRALLPQRASLTLAGSEINLMRASRSAERLRRLIPVLERYEAAAGPGDPSILRHLLCDAMNTLCVASALAGDMPAACDAAERTVELARRFGDDIRLGKALMDLGNINMGDDPARYAQVIDQGKGLLARGPTYLRLLSEIHSVMAHMLANHRASTDSPERYRAWLATLSHVLAEAQADGFVQEAGAASLMAGICQAMLGAEEAARSFMECIDICYRGNHHETLWRAHVNLAQVCLGEGPRGHENAAHHAGHALLLMSKGLDECLERDREARLAFLRIGMAQALRIWRATGDDRANDLLSSYPDLAEFFSPSFRIPAYLASRWDCVQRGEACYIFY